MTLIFIKQQYEKSLFSKKRKYRKIKMKNRHNNVTIIGAGNSGLAMAADLKARGFSVCLYSHADHDSKWRGIYSQEKKLTATGCLNGQWTIDLLTRNLKKAANFSDHIFLALPSYAQESMFHTLADHITNNHIIINLNGNLSSPLLTKKLKGTSPVIVETNAAPHASRAMNKGDVHISGEKKFIPIAAYGRKIDAVHKKKIGALFKCDLEWFDNIIAVALQAYNGVLHPAPTLLNTGWTEAQNRDFLFYKDGLSPSVGKIVEAIDAERLEIARRYGYKNLRTTLQALQGIYGGESRLISEFAQSAKVYESIKASSDIQNRYLTEDVPFILVPWYKLGIKVGFKAKTIKNIIELASVMHDKDYMKTGRMPPETNMATLQPDMRYESATGHSPPVKPGAGSPQHV